MFKETRYPCTVLAFFTWFKSNDVVSERIVKTSVIKYGVRANIFAEKMWVAFAFAIFFFSKNTNELDTVLTWTVNIFTNKLVKLTTL